MDTFSSIRPSTSPQIFLVQYAIPGQTCTLHFPDGTRMRGAMFNVFTKRMERELQLTLVGAITIHLARTAKWDGWCYVQTKDEQAGCYTCSCYERRSNGDCAHIIGLEQQQELTTLVG